MGNFHPPIFPKSTGLSDSIFNAKRHKPEVIKPNLQVYPYDYDVSKVEVNKPRLVYVYGYTYTFSLTHPLGVLYCLH